MISLIRKLIIWISDRGLLNRCVNGSCCSLIFSFYEVFCRSLSSSCVLCVRCCQCFWIVHSWLPLRFSLTFSPMPYTWTSGIEILFFWIRIYKDQSKYQNKGRHHCFYLTNCVICCSHWKFDFKYSNLFAKYN